MTRVIVNSFTLSADGYGAGPDQGLDHPLGRGGESLHVWALRTRTFQNLIGKPGAGETGVDDRFAARGVTNIGAWILGRNMFGPIRGPWIGEWNGWWGEEPPYRCPVFVLTHHAREPLAMTGGTVFHFVTEGAEAALARAKEAAQGKDVRIGGGVATLRHYLRARAIDEMHLAISPVLLGGGESLLAGLDLPALGYHTVESAGGNEVLHVVVRRKDRGPLPSS